MQTHQPTEIIENADAALRSVEQPEAPALFTHFPRAADHDASGPYAWQRRFGADRAARIFGIETTEPAARGAAITVFRDGRAQVAELRADSGNYGGSHASVAFTLDAIALRELARRLIDAAADLDAHPAPAPESERSAA